MQIRLYVPQSLSVGDIVPLSEGQAHYLRNVLRAEIGTELFIFNGKDGEFFASLAALDKKKASAEVLSRLREQPESDDIRLYFAPLKKDNTNLVVEKATELGATLICPVITEFTTTSRVNTERLQAVAIEAAEQCRRLDIPAISEPISLKQLLSEQNVTKPLLVHLDETGSGMLAVDIFAGQDRIAFLVGPEGGFSEVERELIAQTGNTTGMDLGPRILRAETAAIAVLSLYSCR